MTKNHKVDLWIENPVLMMIIINKIINSNNNNNNNLKCKYKTIIILIKDKANKRIIAIIEDISKEIINNKEEWWEVEDKDKDITIKEMAEMGMVIINSQENKMTVLYMSET